MFQQMQRIKTNHASLATANDECPGHAAERPEVAGVKMASGQAGTPMQIAKRGISGAFGRKGMRIQALNV